MLKTMDTGARRRVAVIGGGISGLAAAHLLAPSNEVVLMEAAPALGGHARTVLAGKRGDQPVDTGFIVFNRVNYPRLTALFEELDVATAPSTMSFGASFGAGRFEYALTSPAAIFAQRRNLIDPRFLRMLRDITRFNARAAQAVRDPEMTISDLLRDLGTGSWFRDRYLLPFTGAIWSTPTQRILDFPAETLVRFFRNHALMSYTGQHQWYTVRGGSVEYVRRLAARLVAQGVEIRTACPVAAVRRSDHGARIRPHGGDWEGFDDVVLATHSDDALALLADPTPAERAALSAIRFQPNEAVLHSDVSLMPRRRRVWSSWVYSEDDKAQMPGIGLTYWMNSLQPIPKDDPLFVSLNTTRAIRDELVHDVTTFNHPVYDVAALRAQQSLHDMNGTLNTGFCGAWMRNGFHEDGFASAEDAVRAMAARAGAPRARVAAA